MKLIVLGANKVKRGYIKESIQDYEKRIKRYTDIELVEVKGVKQSQNNTPDVALKKESEIILARLMVGDFLMALHSSGKSHTSQDFAKKVEEMMASRRKRVCFVIGGAYGLHQDIIDRADSILSLSPMTLPHEIARLVLLEQIYRAFTIIKGEPYSH